MLAQCEAVGFVAFALVLKWCPNAEMHDSLPLLGLEVGSQCSDVRFVAVALVSKWCPNAKMYLVAAALMKPKLKPEP